MASPLVSIIVPAYNASRFVAETLDSIRTCGYDPLEVIVVDDGSTDDTCQLVQTYVERDERITLLRQENMGVSYARNHAIREARGKYILPVDADDLLLPGFLQWAVDCLERRPEVEVAVPRAEFFGARQGEWRMPKFSLSLLARKNMIPVSALYRRSQWERVGGYCTTIQAREDWDFWIGVLKDGGEVAVSPEVGLRYRIHRQSKRKTDRRLKRRVVDSINRRHFEFEYRQLDGPLHFHRSWSKPLNRLFRLLHPRSYRVAAGFDDLATFVKALPYLFSVGEGRLLKKDRNEIREMHFRGRSLIVKSFAVPNIVNRLVYGLLRPSKARRSFDYAVLLQQRGIGTPTPVAWLTERRGLLFTRSYYVSLKSECEHTFQDVLEGRLVSADALEAVSKTTARLHDAGMLHKDYSQGNILIGLTERGAARIELVDLNRMRFFRRISVERGLQNLFERLPVSGRERELMERTYRAHREEKLS